ncbi:MAG: hypothetical protein EZS28_031248 [Streblomastix strix]|uniref:Uncharacterized protein n=1 Tax=Streblomastix strix TaxID=222440 RepID=A0A5J4UU26_9EUKA|nr:MAG: hypothetical protein EZS28_031248 [Streblomastix strix]
MGFVNLKTNQTIQGIKTFLQPIYGTKFIITGGASNQILLANGDTQDTGDFLPKYYPHAMGQLTIEPNDDIRNQGIRIMKNKANWDSFVLTGCNAGPSDRDGVWKVGSTSSQFRIQKQEDEAYDYKDPNTQCQTGYTLFSIVNNDIKPKFSGTTHNLPLNAVLFGQKVYGYPICWNGAIPIDCFINPNGFNETVIYALDQLDINWHAIFKTIWEAAIKYACESKICR